jgi:hypothetical protein
MNLDFWLTGGYIPLHHPVVVTFVSCCSVLSFGYHSGFCAGNLCMLLLLVFASLVVRLSMVERPKF